MNKKNFVFILYSRQLCRNEFLSFFSLVFEAAKTNFHQFYFLKNIIRFFQLFLLVSLSFASESYATDQKISIDAFKFIKASPEAVDFEVSISNGTGQRLCVMGFAKSKDGIIRSYGVRQNIIEQGTDGPTSIQVLRPYGNNETQTEILFFEVFSCIDSEVLSTKVYSWPYDWKPSPKTVKQLPPEERLDNYLDYPTNLFYENILDEDFDRVDILFDKWNKKGSKDVSGNSSLAGFNQALGSICDPRYWEKCLSKIKHWKRTNSPLTNLAEAKFWQLYAWNIRGSRYSKDIDPFAMKIFLNRMTKATQILQSSSSLKNITPIWYETYLETMIDANKDVKSIENLFNEATRKYPNYLPLYSVMANFWVPVSGDHPNWHKLDELINKATAFTYDPDEDSNYARLYAEVSQQQRIEVDIFRDSPVLWSKMKDSFNTIIRLYPSANNLNSYAYFACKANDKSTFLTLLPKVSKRVVPEIWPGNYSVDLCKHMFTQKS